MPIAALLDNPGSDIAPTGPSTYLNHAWEMRTRFAASAPGAGWGTAVYNIDSVRAAVLAAIEDGRRVFFAGYGTLQLSEIVPLIAAVNGVLIAAIGNDPRSYQMARFEWPMIAVSVGARNAGNVITGWGSSTWACIETHDLAVAAQSWGVASAAAILTRYPEAATNPQAALVRMLSGAQPLLGAARWTEREGFGLVKTFDHTLAGEPIRVGELPTSNAVGYEGATGTVTAVAGGYRYAYTSAHPFLVAYRSMPPPGAGNGAHWTFTAANHHATQSVRLRSRNGGGSVVLAPGESGTYTLDSFSPDSPFFIETPNGVGGQVDVTVTGLTQDVYEHVTTLPDLAPEGGALSPILTLAQEGAAGRYRAKMIRLGTSGASLRVNGVETLQTSSEAALLYLPAGVATIEARGVLPGGGLTEAHAPGTASVTVAQGYVPPAPSVEIERTDGKLLVSAEAEGATSFVVTAQAGDEAPALVENGEVAWPAHLPARVMAVAEGAGGQSDTTSVLVPARRASPTRGVHPRAVLG